MSFNVDMTQVFRYSNNIFASLLPLIWPFAGAAFAIFVFGGIMFLYRKFAR